MKEQRKREPRILIVDDEDDFRLLLKTVLSEQHFRVDDVDCGENAMRAIQSKFYDLALLDVKMPGMDGMQLLNMMRQASPAMDCVMITGFNDIELAVESVKMGARDYLTKPIEPDELTRRLRTILHTRDAETRLKELQTEFTLRLLYELQTPLTTAKSAVEFLERGTAGLVTEQQKVMLSGIDDNLSKMETLLRDLIDLTEFECGRTSIEKRPTNLDELIPTICERIKPRANAKKISFSISIGGTIPTIETDPDRIEQVVANLLDNAIKYTDEAGTIQTTIAAIRQKVDGSDREFVEVAVSDSGVGISKEELILVFDKFKDFYTGRTTKQKTTGLGLAICRSIIEAHGGTITVDSEVGKGSTFKFYLPVDSF